jgi:uncharacterized protein YuzE
MSPMRDQRVPVRMTFDREANAAYIYLREIEAAGVARTAPGADSSVNLDFDSEDRLIGIEILDATASLPAELLAAIQT